MPVKKEKQSKPRGRKPRASAVTGPAAPKEAPLKRYLADVGRHKEASAVVRLYEGKGPFSVNGRPVSEYFPERELQDTVLAPLKKLGLENSHGVNVRVRGGGMRGQAVAVRLGLSRALVAAKAENRGRLKGLGYLTRDSRVKERRKYGLKKARRAPQWAKR